MTGWMSERVGEQVVSSCVGECVRGRAGGLVCECVCGEELPAMVTDTA